MPTEIAHRGWGASIGAPRARALSTIRQRGRKRTAYHRRGLADALVGSLNLDFAFVRLCDPKGDGAIEVTRGVHGKHSRNGCKLTWPWASSCARKSLLTLATGSHAAALSFPLASMPRAGLVAAACSRTDFPSEIDQLLLSVAANHAAGAFQNARLRHELDVKVVQLGQARNELERKVSERTADLQRSEAYLAEAQRLSHTGSWAFNAREAVYWSDENFRIWGFNPQHGLPDRETVLQRIHPEDRDRVVEYIQKTIREKGDYAVEFRIVLPEGTVKHIHGLAIQSSTRAGSLLKSSVRSST